MSLSFLTWRPRGLLLTPRVLRKLFVMLAVLVVGLGIQLHTAGVAFAYGTCSPSSQTTKLQYTNMGCIYTNPVWFYQTPGNYAHVKLSFDSSVPSKLVTDLKIGANDWTNAGGHVDFSTTCTDCGNNLVSVSAVNDCSVGWWGQGDSVAHTVKLNLCYLSGKDTVWQGLIAHELGHTMGLAHNRWNNGGALMFGCDYPGQFSDCIIHLYTPQPVDVDILNTIFPVYSALCSKVPNDEDCNGQDYIMQSCNHYPQETVTSGSASVTLEYSTNCQSNFTSAQVPSGYFLVSVDIERAGNTVDPALTLSDGPGTTTWYTNMIWAPFNKARSCFWYAQDGSIHVVGPICTDWH
ncbi:MAG TPA: hypothetical protein VKT82_33610 [Ktedonobacterales bacterium]|nr:hypothetical protein [Ktedonobacterales bacterium]